MSGRKASEVNTLLRNGEKTRSASMDILNSAYRNAHTACKKLKETYEETKREISSDKLVISDEVKQEIPDVARKLEQEYNAFVKEFSDGKETYILDADGKSYKALLSRYEHADKKAENIRKIIADKLRSSRYSDQWYCDAEYASARNIETEYSNLSLSVNSMRSQFSAICSKASNNSAIIAGKKISSEKCVNPLQILLRKQKRLLK